MAKIHVELDFSKDLDTLLEDVNTLYLLSAFHSVGKVPGGKGNFTTISPISLGFAKV